ncbi:phage major capsid protein [Pseudomonas sp. BMS12]|uniref:phage major capsid protein n=1 Tax=Pseudomonas sp. BMS12 TaxID=1796033 RepID=UPI000B184B88|nr:phage major capsid protein [Pseudomonas sp. BMS12]
MTQVSIAPKGQTFVRSLILRATTKHLTYETARDIATARWGQYQGELIAKAAVAPIMQSDVGEIAATEFFSLVMERSLLGRLAGLRRLPFNRKMLKITSGSNGYWVAESNPVPLSKPALDGSSLPPLKVCAMIVATDEALKTGGAIAENGFQRDLERAIVDTTDIALLDASNAGVVDERPAAITYGAPSTAATSDAAADIAALIGLFGGDLGTAYFVTDATTATNMALLRTAEGGLIFPDVGARGGSVLGIPLLISRASPRDSNGGQLALIDPTGIAYGADGLTFESAEHATVAMSDTPESDPVLVSLWQRNLVGYKSIMSSNWEVQRDGSVALLTSVAWGA